jgi:hypothetical protein
MGRRVAANPPGHGRRRGQERGPGPGSRRAAWVALLGIAVVGVTAATSILEIWESPTWPKVVLIVAGALAAAVGIVLEWQDRRAAQDAKQAAEQERLARRLRAEEAAKWGHWDPRGRGVVPYIGRRGWYFTGRVRVLQELAGWLADASRGQPVRVVTGDPGSGKSAVLGRLVTLAHPDGRRKALAVDPGLDRATLPPEGAIDLAVHARQQTSGEVVEWIAAAAEIDAATDDELLRGLAERDAPLTVVVDALDEAADAEKVAGLLARLAGTGKVRLLVGTRRSLVSRLIDPSAALDLDGPAYLEPGDVVEYVRRCLLLEGDPNTPTPYRGQPDLAGTVAEAVAKRAGRSFLVAQLVSLNLVDAHQVVDVTESGWRERFPREVGEAMREYLDRFGADRAKVRDLLVPLAFAEGEGLADEVLWAALASELGTRAYQPQDVAWLLRDTSAPNLLQRTEPDSPNDDPDGGASWRLFHEALAEYLRDQEAHYSPQEVQRRYVRILLARVTGEEGHD